MWMQVISQNQPCLCAVDSMNGMVYVVKATAILEKK